MGLSVRAKEKVLRIGEVAIRYGLHPQTLRLYEREGLLAPSRSRGNNRAYGEKDLARLDCILSLSRDLGVNLAGIAVILNMRERLQEVQGEVARLEALVEAQWAAGPVRPREGALVKAPPRPLVASRGRTRSWR